jgi:hypothetical protein
MASREKAAAMKQARDCFDLKGATPESAAALERFGELEESHNERRERRSNRSSTRLRRLRETGERLGDCWLLPRPFARIIRTDQNQFDVSVWRQAID